MDFRSFYPLLVSSFFFLLIILFSILSCKKKIKSKTRTHISILNLNPFIGLFTRESYKSKLLKIIFISCMVSWHLFLDLIYFSFINYFEFEARIESSVAAVFAFVCSKPLTVLRLISDVKNFKTEMKLFALLVPYFLALGGLGYFALKMILVETSLWVQAVVIGVVAEFLLETIVMLCRSTMQKMAAKRNKRVNSEKSFSKAKISSFFHQEEKTK